MWVCTELCTINTFELKSVSAGQRDQKVTSAEGVVHPVVSSVLSHLLAVTSGCVLCSDPLTQLTHRVSSSASLRPGQPGSSATAETLSWASSMAQRPEALGDIQGRSEAWGHFTAGPSFYLGHSSLELHWISLPQMPSNVCSSPEGSSGLLCLSLWNTGDKIVDETRGLVTSVLGDMRCRGYMCNFLTRMWPKHLHMQHLENTEWLL